MSVKAWRNSSPQITYTGNCVTPVGNGCLSRSSHFLWFIPKLPDSRTPETSAVCRAGSVTTAKTQKKPNAHR